jgi:pimeloyl-ACP methyl ester carboxylesterase
LVILGGRDRIVGAADAAAARARRHVAGCEIEILPTAGHAMGVDEPALVGSRITRFLGSDS